MRSENNKGSSAHLRADETQYRTGNGVLTRASRRGERQCRERIRALAVPSWRPIPFLDDLVFLADPSPPQRRGLSFERHHPWSEGDGTGEPGPETSAGSTRYLYIGEHGELTRSRDPQGGRFCR